VEVLVHGLHNSFCPKNCDNILGTCDTVYSEVEHGVLEGALSVWPANSVLVCHIVCVATWNQSAA